MMRRHELDPVSLTFGFAFTGLGLLFLLGRADQALRLGWIWPVLLFAIGVAILLDVARTRPSHNDLDPVPEAPPEPEPEADTTLDRTEASDAAETDAAESDAAERDPGEGDAAERRALKREG
jgi:hypothetical protein